MSKLTMKFVAAKLRAKYLRVLQGQKAALDEYNRVAKSTHIVADIYWAGINAKYSAAMAPYTDMARELNDELRFYSELFGAKLSQKLWSQVFRLQPL